MPVQHTADGVTRGGGVSGAESADGHRLDELRRAAGIGQELEQLSQALRPRGMLGGSTLAVRSARLSGVAPEEE